MKIKKAYHKYNLTMFKYLFIFCFLFLIKIGKGQDWYILQNNIYDGTRVSQIYGDNVKRYHMIGNYTIDRDNDGEIDSDRIKSFLKNTYKPTDSGFLLLDWEGKVFDDLIYYKNGHRKYIDAERKFLDLIKLVKSERPYLKVGIYGLPFRNYNPKIKTISDYLKFNNLLLKVDVLTPSMYVPYDKRGYEEQKLKGIEVIERIGAKYNKIALPVVWSTLYPNRSSSQRIIMKPKELKEHLLQIYNSSKTGIIKGFLIWEPDNVSYSKPRGVSAKEGRAIQTNYIINFFKG